MVVHKCNDRQYEFNLKNVHVFHMKLAESILDSACNENGILTGYKESQQALISDWH